MILRELTARLQTLCYDGWSEKTVGIKILDAHYDIGEVLKVTIGNEEDEDKKVYFVIDTEVK